ncbi:MAG: Uncharacterized protein XD76_0603 [candidate division TA06 bacterium 32_111]|uniref:DUF4236 domain-containing protein n=2 Tax=Bacteria candidate phyla TaxID=1783234 RepID=A0A117M6Z5_UNCT6|nr:MAG: Uncharacterized protein XD76_0603 [candidate division TA06 bacterium 32_111]KUK87789.1 MAG: Uncharacterized protein XE03_0308 [candidate division TA06 bacterium 34_109]HAF07943.1 hypothetical protein [candidate division WOR-3 bacterium]HCP16355.1 hypothetical protein [candidate division WOR-3 bacterium]
MAIRFRRTVRIFPFTWLNINKGGISFSFGVPGLKFTRGKQKSFSLGIPGTGLFYRRILKKKKNF